MPTLVLVRLLAKNENSRVGAGCYIPFLAVAPEQACRASTMTIEGFCSVVGSSPHRRWYATVIPA
jgi:hypothetical protein